MKPTLTYDQWIALIHILTLAEKDSIDDDESQRAVDLLKRIDARGDPLVEKWRDEWIVALEHQLL